MPAGAKWVKTLGWTPRDDAALLLGVHFHGLGHWEQLIRDTRLGLQDKLGCVLAGGAAGGAGGAGAGAGGAKEDGEAAGGDKGQVMPKGG